MKTATVFGATISDYTCLYCGSVAQSFVGFNLCTDNAEQSAGPSIVLSYALCNRCKSLYWEEAGQKFVNCMREDFATDETT